MLGQGRVRAYLGASLLLAIPALILLGLGLAFLWEKGWLLWYFLALSISSVPLFWLRQRHSTKVETSSDDLKETYLEAKKDWSSLDTEVWQAAVARIQSLDLKSTEIGDVQELVAEQWAFVAQRYRSGSDSLLSFSLPEALLVLEVLSRDYRRLILSNIPAAQNITLAQARSAHASGKRWQSRYEKISGLWRVARLVLNPVGGMIGELRSQALSMFISDVSGNVQLGLARSLLEEVSQVAIDLYSGRLRISDEELNSYLLQQAPIGPSELPPLRVILVGQTNAGKSSLTNALKDMIVAEVDALPSTDKFASHLCDLGDGIYVELVDSVGLDGSDSVLQSNLDEAQSSDIVLLVCAVNQPAKAADLAFVDAWRRYFAAHLSRLEPATVLITTHNDRLKPQQEWAPPYDLVRCESQKETNMRDALLYARDALGLGDETLSVPVAIPAPDKAYNVDVLADLIREVALSVRGAQLNRLRLQAKIEVSTTTGLLRQAVRAGKILGRPLVSDYLTQLRDRFTDRPK